MWRWAKRLFIAVTALVLLAALSGAVYERVADRRARARTPPPGRLVDVGGFRLHIWCTGSGSPLVILESGLGGAFVSWGYVQPEVARFTRACAYDRAGLGYSDPGPTPRTAARMAAELRDLLDRSGISEPLVLVGASSGGLSMRMLATQQPARVKGLVLVDASHEDQRHDVPPIAPFVPALATIGAFRVFGVSFGSSPESLAAPVRPYARAVEYRAANYRAAADEIIHMPRTAAEVRQHRRRLPHPVVVITAGRGADARWRALQQDQVTLSARGCQIVAEDSGHAIPLQQPEVVVHAIRTLIDAARAGNDAPPCGGAPAR